MRLSFVEWIREILKLIPKAMQERRRLRSGRRGRKEMELVDFGHYKEPCTTEYWILYWPNLVNKRKGEKRTESERQRQRDRETERREREERRRKRRDKIERRNELASGHYDLDKTFSFCFCFRFFMIYRYFQQKGHRFSDFGLSALRDVYQSSLESAYKMSSMLFLSF